MSKRKNIISVITSIVSILIIGIGIGIFAWIECGNSQTYTVVEISIEQKMTKAFQDKYIIYLTLENGDKLTVENEDSLFMGKFNSSDFIGTLKEYEESGEVFEIKTVSYRIGFFSMYQNIVEIKENENE